MEPGTRFGRYRLDEKLGEGGMAEAWRATLIAGESPAGGAVGGAVGGAFEKRVCLKRVLPEHAGTPAFVDMFRDEARIAARLQHTNIVQVFELGQAEGTFFIAMELVDGCGLNTILKKGVRASVCQALAIGVALTRALDHAHRATVDGTAAGANLELIHRDVTPENILISKDGDLKLADFGIARARDRLTKTKTGIIKGKLSYMAPEQARGEPIDQRLDQWAAAVVVWEVLTGRPLFRRKGELAILQAVTRDPVPPPSSVNPAVPREVDAILLRALARPRELRWPTMGALHDALARALVHLQQSPDDVDLRPLVAAALSAPDAKPRAAALDDAADPSGGGVVDDAGDDSGGEAGGAVIGSDDHHAATVSEGMAQAFQTSDATVPSQVAFVDERTELSDPALAQAQAPSRPASSRPASSSSLSWSPPKTASTARPALGAARPVEDRRGLWVAGGVASGIVVAVLVVVAVIVGAR